MADKEVVETLMKFNDKMPTKGLVRVYLSLHLIVDLECIFLYFNRYIVFEGNNRCFLLLQVIWLNLGRKT